jgi:hypothetical protein
VATLRRTQAQLLDLLLAGTVSREDYERKRAELASAGAQLTLGRDSLAESGAGKLELLRTFFRALTDAVAVFDSADADGKKLLLRQVGIELEATDDGARVLAGKPASVLLARAGHPITWRLVEDVLNAFSEGVPPETAEEASMMRTK